MTAGRRILVLHAADAIPGDLRALVDGLAARGAAVVVRRCDDDYDALLDAIAAADTVMCWS